MITLYQFQGCPFCSKVRALLNYSKTPYEVVDVSPRGMKELKGITNHKKVPVLRDVDTDGNEKVIVESAKIIEYINEHYAKLPVTAADKKWTDWVDDTLVHYLPPLIHPDFKTSYTHIRRISPAGGFKGFMIAFIGAMVMPKVARKMKQKYNIQDPQKEYLDAIDHWVDEGLKGQAFHGGEQPDIVDCSVFGVLRSGHQLGVVKLAKHHNRNFALWYDKCYPLMSGDRVSNLE